MVGKRLTAAQRRARNRAIVAAYCGEQPVDAIARRHGITPRMVSKIADTAGVARPRGRPAIWPDCPAEHRSHYRYLRHRIPEADARAAILALVTPAP